MDSVSNAKVKDSIEAIRSGDPVRRSLALKPLYLSQAVRLKIADWAKFFGLSKIGPDDILQEAVIKLDEKIRAGEFRGECSLETFLLAICKNLIRDSTRTPGKVVYKGEITDGDWNDPDFVADQLEVREQSGLENQRDKLLLETIEGMKGNCPEDLKMFYFEQKNMAQIAEKRSLSSADMAKKAVYRCRQQLRELIERNPILMDILNQLS